MRVLGYTFDQSAHARRAQRVVTDRYHMLPGDAEVADVADDGFVLGIRAREENVPELNRVLKELGGEPVIDVDERWTGLPPRRR